MQWFAQAPSNIALIKYMGKQDAASNLPDNPSLSYTLNHLLSSVGLEQSSLPYDTWAPLMRAGNDAFELSPQAQARFLRHLANLKAYFNYSGTFIVRSNNNFPHSSGLASSASSFAALTRCAVNALTDLTQTPLPSVDIQAALSRQGSGSSCRSFFLQWALWDNEQVEAIQLPHQDLIHQVIVISRAEKAVSSSEAHQRVRTSPDYATRGARARRRLNELLSAFNQKDWASAYQICWDEFQDMHQLFECSERPFSYMTEQTHTILSLLSEQWAVNGDGPLITMDAGPNIHLLYRPDQQALAHTFKQTYLIGQYDVL